MSINKVLASGNLTRDPELHQTAGGMPILSFTIAVNDRRRNQQSGEWEDYANYIDCTMFGNRAQSLSDYLSKGTKVAIEGKLRYSSWEKDGVRRSKIEVVIDELEFMSRDASRDVVQQQYERNTSNMVNNALDKLSQTKEAAERALFANIRQDTSLHGEDIPF